MISRMINTMTTRYLPKILPVDSGKRLSILVYHRVLVRNDPMRPGVPDVNTFNWQMELISKYFHPLSIEDALDRLVAGELPERGICVTFDDGYADNLLHALPVLQRWNIPATVFVSSGFLDGGRMWNDSVIEAFSACNNDKVHLPEIGFDCLDISTPERRLESCHQTIKAIKYLEPNERLLKVDQICLALSNPELPNDLMLTRDQLRMLSEAGIEIGNHTVSHPVLSAVDDEIMLKELKDNSSDLESTIQKPVRFFAYPNGIPGKDFQPHHRNMVKSLGFHGAVTTEWGVSDSLTDRWALPRFTPWDQTPQRFAARLIMNMKSLR